MSFQNSVQSSLNVSENNEKRNEYAKCFPKQKSKMRETIINTNFSSIHPESLRDHEWGERAPPQNGGKARNKWGFGRFYRKVSIWFWLV